MSDLSKSEKEDLDVCRLLLLILCMFIVHVMYYKLPVADLRHAEVVHLYVKPYDRRVLCYYII